MYYLKVINAQRKFCRPCLLDILLVEPCFQSVSTHQICRPNVWQQAASLWEKVHKVASIVSILQAFWIFKLFATHPCTQTWRCTQRFFRMQLQRPGWGMIWISCCLFENHIVPTWEVNKYWLTPTALRSSLCWVNANDEGWSVLQETANLYRVFTWQERNFVLGWQRMCPLLLIDALMMWYLRWDTFQKQALLA